jgi:hypothetical protein
MHDVHDGMMATRRLSCATVQPTYGSLYTMHSRTGPVVKQHSDCDTGMLKRLSAHGAFEHMNTHGPSKYGALTKCFGEI